MVRRSNFSYQLLVV